MPCKYIYLLSNEHDYRVMDHIRKKLGLVHVYTGNGKGKTTASMGLGFRASGRGLNVLMIQFLKPDGRYGEHIASEQMENFTILPMGVDFRFTDSPSENDKKVAQETLAFAKERIYSGKYDLVILDEANVAMSLKLIDPQDLIDMLKGRPENVEIVLSGRGAPASIIEYADLVTEMKLIKHPFDRGIGARKGIEF